MYGLRGFKCLLGLWQLVMLLSTLYGPFTFCDSSSVLVKRASGLVLCPYSLFNFDIGGNSLMEGMTYYLTLWYPTSRIAHRIGWYFTAAQLSAAVVGLVSAGFQKMNGDGGLRGYAWYPHPKSQESY
jgi:hypothetical protein